MNTLDIIQIIASRHPDITSFKFVTYEAQKDLAQQFKSQWSDNDSTHYRQALDMRSRINLPFWNSIMLSMINSGSLSANCLSGASLHNPITEICNLPPHRLNTIHSINFPAGRKAVNSVVTLADGRQMHIPMLDFHIEISPANTCLITKICSFLNQQGYILNSGKSYHFIGTALLTTDALNRFLGKALLFTPAVDEIWIAHQLQEQSCTLRFGEKHGMIPTVIASL